MNRALKGIQFGGNAKAAGRLTGRWWIAVILCFCWSSLGVRAAGGLRVLGWNNLGMHCMDADFSVFTILPPYNTIHCQFIDGAGQLVLDPTGLLVTYEAVADPSGSINRTSAGKCNFWSYVQPLFGVALPVDVGLPVPGPNSFAMPGANNTPQAMNFDASAEWFAAYGIPITPYDDAGNKNTYPMMRLSVRQGTTLLATADIVLPVSDEMDCTACHASSSNPAARPASGWVNDPNPQRDFRLNILRFHDDDFLGTTLYHDALQAKGYSANGLYATVVNNGTPILCAACHLSEALPGSGLAGIAPLTAAVHSLHAQVVDPSNGLTLDSSDNRTACYRCHPGAITRCLRGVMGRAVAVDGTLAIQCQSCHGSMSMVGAVTRTGWLEEPNCQACHTGTAVSNNGQIRYTSVFDAPGHMRLAVDQTFATSVGLYRFSRGHGGIYCEACHGSTHAEFPTSHSTDNIISTQIQGHVGTMVECIACHVAQPATVSGGPHGLHPLGQTWVQDPAEINDHAHAVETGGAAQCQVCHGLDYRGTVLSRSHADRAISTPFGAKSFWRGFQIGCYACHNGPNSETANPNHAPVVSNTSVSTTVSTSLAIPLTATDADGNPLTLRMVSQPNHGTVGLVGTVATYFPETGYVGGDAFTFAAWDGSVDSNLGTVTVSVSSGGGCSYSVAPLTASFTAAKASGSVAVTTATGCRWTARSNVGWISISSGSSGTGKGTVKYTVAANKTKAARTGTLTVAGYSVTISQSGGTANLTGAWVSPTPVAALGVSSADAQKRPGDHAAFVGHFRVDNIGETEVGHSVLEFHFSPDSTLDEASDPVVERHVVGKLAPGQSLVYEVNFKPSGATAHGSYVIAEVDADGELGETDAADNVAPFGPLP